MDRSLAHLALLISGLPGDNGVALAELASFRKRVWTLSGSPPGDMVDGLLRALEADVAAWLGVHCCQAGMAELGAGSTELLDEMAQLRLKLHGGRDPLASGPAVRIGADANVWAAQALLELVALITRGPDDIELGKQEAQRLVRMLRAGRDIVPGSELERRFNAVHRGLDAWLAARTLTSPKAERRAGLAQLLASVRELGTALVTAGR